MGLIYLTLSKNLGVYEGMRQKDFASQTGLPDVSDYLDIIANASDRGVWLLLALRPWRCYITSLKL